MDEHALLTSVQDLLGQQYGQSDCSWTSLNTRTVDDERVVYQMYRVDGPGDDSWVVCAAHDALMTAHTFRWGTLASPSVWLERRATLLAALASQGYPVAQVIRALSGRPVVRSGSWSVLVTTFLDGPTRQFTPEALSQAGHLLARLHTLPLEALPVWPSWWNSTYSIPHAIEELEEVIPSIPASHTRFAQACHTSLYTIGRALETLPEVLIHGDCWMQNAVVTPQGMVFIDWESAGRGAAILDLADFLLRSQCDTHGAPPTALNERHVTAAVSGYARQRMPSQAERDLLVAATRFSSAWRAAWMFTRVRSEGWTPRIEQGLTRLQRTSDLAEPTAFLARSAFQRDGPDVS